MAIATEKFNCGDLFAVGNKLTTEDLRTGSQKPGFFSKIVDRSPQTRKKPGFLARIASTLNTQNTIVGIRKIEPEANTEIVLDS